MTSSRRFHLRQSTADDHQRLDDMIAPFDDRFAYENYVRSIYAFRAPVERLLGAVPLPESWHPWAPLRVKDALDRDLQALGMTRPQTDPSTLSSDTPEALLGILYTLEGSSLGARLLLRRAEAIGLDEGNGAAHLARQAEAGGSWRGFLDILDSGTVDMEAVAASSRATFAFARQSFERFVREPC